VSRPSCRRRACPVHCQTVRPCCKVHYVHHHLCIVWELPLHANTTQIADVRVQEDCSSNSKYYISYIPRPTCRGPVPLYVPPLSYKGGGMQRYMGTGTLRPNLDLDQAQAHKFIRALKLNLSHSGVGYYASAAQTTLKPCVFLSSSFIYQQEKRLSPLLILGFRAGALCHPAGEFPLRHLARQVGG
jgi:hypothetical protein